MKLSPRLRERLSRLARGLAEPVAAGPEDAEQPRLEQTLPQAAMPPAPQTQPWCVEYDLPGCGAPLAGPAGTCFLVEADLASLLLDHGERVDAWRRLPAGEWGEPERRLFLDIETGGLSAAPLFLIGTLSLGTGALRLRQFLARDYTEEPAVLAGFIEWSGEYDHLVTFNGQTFDLPYLIDRALYHRLAAGLAHRHIDLIGPARRRWRGQVPDCRLVTLESHVCSRRRLSDVPSADIPRLYHDFVREPRWEMFAPVLHHNALDLLTMAELATRLAA